MMNVQPLEKISTHSCKVCGKEYEKKYIEWGNHKKEYYSPVCNCEEAQEEKNQKNKFHIEQGKKIISKIRAVKNCGFGKRYKDKSFINYDKSRNLKAYKLCLEYAKNIEERLKDGRGLFLTGNIGTGKTHLAAGIVDYIARIKKRKISCQIAYITSVDLLAQIRMSFNTKGQDIVGYFEEADLLIIDDLGVEKVTDWVNEILYKIIDHRYNELKPTIFITNLKEDEIKEKIGERVTSRIFEMCKGIEFTGKDYRIFK